MKKFRISVFGIIGVTFYLGMFAGAYFFNAHSISHNSANSGEGGIILILYAMPWVMMFAKPIVGFSIGMITNTFIIYLVAAGVGAIVKMCRHSSVAAGGGEKRSD